MGDMLGQGKLISRHYSLYAGAPSQTVLLPPVLLSLYTTASEQCHCLLRRKNDEMFI